jgi:asparaginyl-tRNA synthetase
MTMIKSTTTTTRNTNYSSTRSSSSSAQNGCVASSSRRILRSNDTNTCHHHQSAVVSRSSRSTLTTTTTTTTSRNFYRNNNSNTNDYNQRRRIPTTMGGVSPLLSSSSCSSSSLTSSRAVTMTMMRRSVKNTRLSTTSGRSAAGENSSTTQTTTTYKRRDRLAQIKGNDRGKSKVGKTLELKGWVRSNRAQKDRAFIDLNDGSDMSGMQMVVLQEHVDENVWQLVAGATSEVSTGASIRVKGKVVESPGGKQSVEVLVDELEIIGKADPATYPLQKKRHTLEYLRGIAHLRPRTNTIAAVSRVRNQLAFATHQFFQQNGFLYVNTPIITASDCEGAGEQFQVTCLLNGLEEEGSAGAAASVAPQDVEKVEQKVKSQGDIVKKTKADKGEGNATKEDVDREVKKLLALKEELTELQSGSNTPQTSVKELPKLKSGGVDYEQDFFAKRSYLTVSGQLNGEIMASAVNDIYTFGPTFRAENSNTSRHLAEFWMVEPELAFADLNDDMDCAEAYLKHCITHVLKHCDEDLQFFEKNISKDNLRERLQNVVDQDFARITYTEAVEHVLSAKKKFEFPIQWGSDLQSEHERYISEEVYKDRPVIVRDYPKDIKAFYMRANDDGKTVAAMDVLVPKVGELMGGSQREERLDVLEKKIEEVGLEKESYWWYLELRKYGSVPHSGFGLGFERLVQYVTGVENIRDVIAFPRYPGSADF